MGIKGLLGYLKPISNAVSVPKRYYGRRVGVDMMCLLHRGAMADPTRVIQGDAEGHQAVSRFVGKMISKLERGGVEVVCIFDGDALPAKNAENLARRESRKEARSQTEAALKEGARPEDVYGLACRSVSITASLIRTIINLCIRNNWPYIIAPYEADAQLAYLCRSGYVDAVVSEDSDLLAYGCPRLLTKVSSDGESLEYDLSGMFSATDLGLGEKGFLRKQSHKKESTQQLRSVINPSFTYERFVAMCILAGCDYTDKDEHIPGMGLSTAAKLLFKVKTLEGILNHIQRDKQWRQRLTTQAVDTEKVVKAHERALQTFVNHWVYCPSQNALIPISRACELSEPTRGLKVIQHLRQQIMNWDESFKGCLLDDIENYDAAVLGSCLQRSSSRWREKLYTSQVSQLPPIPKSISSHPIEEGDTPSASTSGALRCDTLSKSDVRTLLSWNPETDGTGARRPSLQEGRGGKALTRKSTFRLRGSRNVPYG